MKNRAANLLIFAIEQFGYDRIYKVAIEGKADLYPAIEVFEPDGTLIQRISGDNL